MKTKFFFFIIFLLCAPPTFAQYGGTTGDLTWNFNVSEGKLTISGEGEMPNYSDYETHFSPWHNVRDYITTVIIEPGVTSIGNRAFFSCDRMTSITIPNSVTSIGFRAFNYCFRLLSVTIPDGVTSIAEEAFLLCLDMTWVKLPASVVNIGAQAFAQCNHLLSIDVDRENEHYTSEDGVLFNKSKTTLIRCPGGKTAEYVIPNSVTVIDSSAFSHCKNLTSIIIPNSVTSIGNYACYLCNSLTSIIIPHSVTSIGSYAFSECTSLTSVSFPNSLTSLEEWTFNSCYSLTSVTLPASLKNIGSFVFYGCSRLTSITLPANLASIGECAFCNLSPTYSMKNLALRPIALSPYAVCFRNTLLYSCLQSLSNCTLIVPTNSTDMYENAYTWGYFNVVSGGFLVNAMANNSEFGYTTGEGLYSTDVVVSVSATAHLGNNFINWTVDGIEVSTENPYSFPVTEDVELIANFEHEVGVIETQSIASLQVYPNPMIGELTITNYELQITGADIQMFDIMGHNLRSFTCPPTRSFTIDISHLHSGIYFVKIKTEKEIITKRIIKL